MQIPKGCDDSDKYEGIEIKKIPFGYSYFKDGRIPLKESKIEKGSVRKRKKYIGRFF